MQGRSIVITSGKGGVGKTTITANLGMALAQLGSRVCLIDTDTGLRNLDLVLGLEQRIIFDLVDVANGTCRLQQALIHDRRQPNLFVLPTSQRCDKSALRPIDMRMIVASLRESFDFVLIDCAAGIEEGFQTAIAGAEEALVVLNPEVSSVRDADRVVGLLNDAKIRDIRVIVNRLRADMVERHDMIGVEDIEELLGVPAIAVLPEDTRVIASTNRGVPLVLDRSNKLARQFESMALTIRGAELRVITLPAAPAGIFGRLKSLFA